MLVKKVQGNPMTKTATSAVIFFLISAVNGSAFAFQCNVCHSKNPAMVRMHKATQAKDIGCFDCHKVGEKLMGKSQPKDMASLLTRRATDPMCVGCHRS